MNDDARSPGPPEQDDAIRVAKPDWMPDTMWAGIQDTIANKVNELVENAHADRVRQAVAASPEGGCTERTWCVMGTNSEHLRYHAGAGVDLDASAVPRRRNRDHLVLVPELEEHTEGERAPGWWVSLSEDRGRVPRLTLEGVLRKDDGRLKTISTEVGVDDAWQLVHATPTPESHATLLSLLKCALEEYVEAGTGEASFLTGSQPRRPRTPR